MAKHHRSRRAWQSWCIATFVLTASAMAQQAGLISRDAAATNDTTGKLYLVDTAHDAITLIGKDGLAKSIEVGTHPNAVAVNRRTGTVYVVNPGSRNVTVIDGASDAPVATVPTAARPYAIAVDEDANKVYVSNTFSNMLTVIDGATNSVSNIKTGSADVVMVDGSHKRVYLMGYESDALNELDPESGSITKIPAGALHLWGLAREGDTLYVSHVQDASIAAVDLQTHNLRTIPTGRMPCAIALNPVHHELYVANYADSTITIVKDGTAIATIHVADHPQSLTVDAGRNLLYVTSPQQNRVDLIDLQARRITHSLMIEGHPYAIGIQPATHAAYPVTFAGITGTPVNNR